MVDPSKFTLKVKAEDITSGMQKNSNHCMIADAIRRNIPEARFVNVDGASIRFTAWGFRYTYRTPMVAVHALNRFDQGDTTLKPFSFRLENPKVRVSFRSKSVGKTASPRKKTKSKPTRKPPSRVLTMDREFGERKFIETGK